MRRILATLLVLLAFLCKGPQHVAHASVLQEPEASGELVRGEPRQGQPLVRTVIVGQTELLEQCLHVRGLVPGVVGEPLLQGAHKPFSDPVTLSRQPHLVVPAKANLSQ